MRARFHVVTLFLCLPLLQVESGASTAEERYAGAIEQKSHHEDCPPMEHYTAEEFFRRLVRVANEADPTAVPRAFERQFHLKLSSTPPAAIVTYRPICKWVTRMQINVFSEVAGTGGPGASFVVGDVLRPESLYFGVPERGECLSQTMVDAMLKADGWSSGVVRWEIIDWFYKIRRRFV